MKKAMLSLLLGISACMPAWAGEAQEEANKQTVLAFYEQAFANYDAEAAGRYLGEQYTQHNPQVADGPQAFKALIGYLKGQNDGSKYSIKRVMADGDLVMLHLQWRSKPEDNGTAVVDIFRLQDGKIVEHWDVMQKVPAKAANSNGMF